MNEIIKKGERNYQLDFMKFIFTIGVFFSHTHELINERTNFYIPTGLGWISVHFFFVVSGLLMVDSFMRRYDEKTIENCRGGDSGRVCAEAVF